MKVNKYIIVLLVGILSFSLNELKGQDASKKDDKVFNESFDVITNIKPKISDATKIDVIPERESLKFSSKAEEKLVTVIYPFAIKSSKSKLMQLQVKAAKPESIPQSLIKGSIGNYSAINFEAYYNTVRNKDALFNLGAKVYSGKAGINFSNFSNTDLALGVKKIISKSGYFLANGSFKYNQFHYYANQFLPDSIKSDNADKLKQNILVFGLGGDYFHQPKDTGKLLYSLGFKYYNLGDFFKLQENFISLRGQIKEPYRLNLLVIDGGFDILNHGIVKSVFKTILRVDAKYQFKYEAINAELGFKTATETDSQSFFRFYPHLKADMELVEGRLSAFGLISGGLTTMTWNQLLSENQWLNTNQRIANQNNKIVLEGGLKGRVDAKWWYLTKLSYKQVGNFYSYVNTPFDSKKFILLYDQSTGIFNFNLESGYQLVDQFNLVAKFDYFNYQFRDSKLWSSAWMLPSITYQLNGNYKYDEQISFWGGVYGQGQRSAYIVNKLASINRTLPAFVDINLGGQFNFNKSFGLYLEFKNILNKQYEQVNLYPVRGFQVLFGAKVKIF